MPFVTAGDPDLAMTQDLIRGLSDAGVHLIEVGFPYSDPIADGPVIQASYTRALGGGVTVDGILKAVAEVNTDETPLLAMVSYAIVFRHGVEKFIADAKAAGFAGFIIPDLPGAEAAECFELVRSQGLDLVQLVAPTTPRERVQEILKSCSGFVYCVAVAGTTGERANVADALLDQLRWLREETDLPLAVGFGISKPEHVDPLRQVADGVIIGSGIVRQLEPTSDGQLDRNGAMQAIADLTTKMVNATSGS
ncbi:MAG: tryptophan synthase subunit alpha [Planctomycetaceae bacterium]|nr:tryptophan synthase subunit alpha [Planctomycetaceae bacterium]